MKIQTDIFVDFHELWWYATEHDWLCDLCPFCRVSLKLLSNVSWGNRKYRFDGIFPVMHDLMLYYITWNTMVSTIYCIMRFAHLGIYCNLNVFWLSNKYLVYLHMYSLCCWCKLTSLMIGCSHVNNHIVTYFVSQNTTV